MDVQKKSIWFLVNPISGTTDKTTILNMIPRIINAQHFNVTIYETEYKGHAAELARKAVAHGIEVVVAVGGDGTVNEVARSLVHTHTALGIIPCGSGNGLARHLSIPMNPEGALEVINHCIIQDLDYGCINETPFFCTCGVGFDAFVSSRFAQSSKRGLLSYIENTLLEGLKYKPESYEIEVDGEDGHKAHYQAFLIACANASQYGNNVYIAPGASMTDGLMDVTIMEPFTMLEAPQIAIQLFNKTISQNSHIRTFKCRRLTIHRTQPGVIHYDGDPKHESSHLEIVLHPQDIRMVVNNQITPSLPPLLRMFNELYTNMNEEITQLKEDIMQTPQRIRSINKELLKKLKS